ncbi:hypothetical protein [Flavobacterium crassostreae]|uniref:Uncharacterized protein n=1 Tax=Flavobacterium crassostreae TaxID=1763534 RepID=A0A1B9E0L0_9FLAO|nr:hypothetical protein [Flavobacterium crassostreae]OCB75464.1 hypothetical protein LPBF_07595 [Flavobacterium crassostreae]
MKSTLLTSVLFFLLSFNSITAQYRNSGYSANGYDRNNRQSQLGKLDQDMDQNKPKEIPVEVTVAKIMDGMKSTLNLDALQEIAIANVLTESIHSQGVLSKNNSNAEQKAKEAEALSETTDRKIKAFLNPDQIEKFKNMKVESEISNQKRRRNR